MYRHVSNIELFPLIQKNASFYVLFLVTTEVRMLALNMTANSVASSPQ